MSSINKECNNLKQKYDACFNEWYTEKYLKGHITEPCVELFKVYKECVWKSLKEKKIDQLIQDALDGEE
jgi:TRIAP1/MDM35 family protein